MTKSDTHFDQAVVAFIEDFDRDIERGEDIIFFGLAIVMLLPIFAPVAPPHVLLPLIAFTFALSASFARLNYHKMERKLMRHLQHFEAHNQAILKPLQTVFQQNPMPALTESFNPLKNLKRTWKSVFGGLLINPFWFLIFYVMGMQILEDQNLGHLNRALIDAEKRLSKSRDSHFCG